LFASSDISVFDGLNDPHALRRINRQISYFEHIATIEKFIF
jgi:hypothetical protein